jgi:hypothetical protein
MTIGIAMILAMILYLMDRNQVRGHLGVLLPRT